MCREGKSLKLDGYAKCLDNDCPCKKKASSLELQGDRMAVSSSQGQIYLRFWTGLYHDRHSELVTQYCQNHCKIRGVPYWTYQCHPKLWSLNWNNIYCQRNVQAFPLWVDVNLLAYFCSSIKMSNHWFHCWTTTNLSQKCSKLKPTLSLMTFFFADELKRQVIDWHVCAWFGIRVLCHTWFLLQMQALRLFQVGDLRLWVHHTQPVS